jgi:hypothetical protein
MEMYQQGHLNRKKFSSPDKKELLAKTGAWTRIGTKIRPLMCQNEVSAGIRCIQLHGKLHLLYGREPSVQQKSLSVFN